MVDMDHMAVVACRERHDQAKNDLGHVAGHCTAQSRAMHEVNTSRHGLKKATYALHARLYAQGKTAQPPK